MDHFHPNVETLRSFSASIIPAKLDLYKVDEGYSEDTRSQDGSEQSAMMDMREARDGSLHAQATLAASLEHAVRGLSEYERSGMIC